MAKWDNVSRIIMAGCVEEREAAAGFVDGGCMHVSDAERKRKPCAIDVNLIFNGVINN